jgi:hypothetical protein
MKTLGQEISSTLNGSKRFLNQSAVILVCFTALGTGRLLAADAAAERLFADAKAKETLAEKLRADSAAKLQEAADDEVAASDAQREARVLILRALQVLKADSKRQRSFLLRHEAQQLWATAHRKWVDARNAEQKAAHCRHNSEEMLKAAGQVKDQAALATALENDAKTQTADAQRAEQAASADRTEAENLDKRAASLWAEAERLDPEMHRQLAAKPEKPRILPAAPR